MSSMRLTSFWVWLHARSSGHLGGGLAKCGSHDAIELDEILRGQCRQHCRRAVQV